MGALHNDDILGSVYISESFVDNKSISGLTKNSSADLFFVTFDTNLQDFDVLNRNQRYYDGKNIWECIQSEKIQSLLATGGWFGEFDHPAPEVEGEKLTPQRIQNVPPKYRAFKIMNPRIEGNVLKARIQSAQGEVGEGFGKEVLAGWIPQFSCRAIATMVMRNGKPYVIVRRLITYDAPWYPSHKIAHATSGAKVTTKSFTESVEDTVTTMLESAKDKIKDVMIPLKEILTDIGRRDVTAGLIMESFDLSMDDLCGFNESHDQIIIKDHDNYIYCNIDPKSVDMVNDFYTSF